MHRLSPYPWYTLLLAAYSPMALIAYNTGQVAYSVVTRSLLIILLSAFVLTTLMIFLVRNVHKAGLIVTVILVLFFSYGHVYELIANRNIGSILIGRHRYLIILYLLILLGTILWVAKSKNTFTQWSSALMTIAVASLFFPVYKLITYELKAAPPAVLASPAQPLGSMASSGEELPDIYYIILDTYGRTDFLKKYAGYDNSPFIESLQKLGFYVASCSQSNYSQTGLSLASSMNFNYLDKLGLDFSTGSKREDLEAPYIKHSAVVDRMREMDYKIVAFETGFDFTTLDDTDILYPAPQSGISDFELVLLRSTALVYLDYTGMFEGIYPTANQNRRDMILFQLKTLKNLASIPGPKFVFAHLITPHFPYVFGPNGESLVDSPLSRSEGELTKKEYFEGYRGQAIFTSNEILDVVSEILQSSDPAPIIIIQGDHGPSHAGQSARMGILNAYYFPGGQTTSLYPEITPVNSFRVLFNIIFDAQFELLPDISYFSRYSSPDETTIIPNECGLQ